MRKQKKSLRTQIWTCGEVFNFLKKLEKVVDNLRRLCYYIHRKRGEHHVKNFIRR
jgi:hypothetical protein